MEDENKNINSDDENENIDSEEEEEDENSFEINQDFDNEENEFEINYEYNHLTHIPNSLMGLFNQINEYGSEDQNQMYFFIN